MNQQPIILFDGICNLCNSSVNFIIKRNNKKEIRFAALQSEIAQKLLKEHNLPVDEIQSIILIENSTAYTQSTAALRISRYLNGLWPLCYGLILVPKFIRNGIYKWIAKNRYKWFGERKECMIPSPAIKERFLT